MKENRIQSIDLVKCVAIWLVLWGHAITELMPQDLSLNEAYVGIYSFHMPLFMLVSGLFAEKSFGKPFVDVLKAKFMQLVLPTLAFFGIAWWLIITLLPDSHSVADFGFVKLHLPYVASGIAPLCDIVGFVKHELSCYWFLKSLFICYTVCYGCWIFGRWKWCAAFVVLCAFLGLQHWDVTCYKTGFMLPFFLLGIWLRSRLDMVQRYARVIFPVSVSAFIILLPYYGLEYSFQAKMFTELSVASLCSYLFFLAMGLAGSMMVVCTCVLIEKQSICAKLSNILSDIGTQTLGIYLWQKLLLELLLPRFVRLDMSTGVYNYLVTPLVAVCLLFAIYGQLRYKESIITKNKKSK